MAPFHVDEATGSDETGKGTPEQPYQTLAFAVYSHPDGPYAIRKDASAAYDEPTQSALKKAKKGADGIEKKRKKAEELAEREAKEQAAAREKKEKKLEESKKIVLAQDPSLPTAIKVRSPAPSTLARELIPPAAIASHRHSRRSEVSLLSGQSAFAHLDGFIGCAIRKRSFSSSSGMALATSNVFCPGKSRKHMKRSRSRLSPLSRFTARSRLFPRDRPPPAGTSSL